MTSRKVAPKRSKAGSPAGESARKMPSRPGALEAVRRVSEEVIRQHDLGAVFESIVAHAVELLHGDGGGLYLVDAESRSVRCVVSQDTRASYVGTVLRFGEGAAGVVAETGQPLNIPDYRVWPQRAAVFERGGPFRAVLSAPLVWQGAVTGVITSCGHAPVRHSAKATSTC
jgi:signal transduction protein with GAF and PtsI domain